MSASSPTVQLNNGVVMPALGLGVFLSPPEHTAEAVSTALESGYRLIDTAAAYFNETEVGEGLRRSGVDREQVFVTTKLWPSDYGDGAVPAFEASLRRLNLDYVDMYMLHWPVPTNFEDTIAAYAALEPLVERGLIRALGVCNFTPDHLSALTERVGIRPAVNQVELHPYFSQVEVRAANEREGVLTQSWSPIGGAYARRAENGEFRSVLQDDTVARIAAEVDKTPAQVVLRWHLEHGFSTIPKSVHAPRIVENFDIFDFSLTAAQREAIDSLDTGVRGGKSHPDTFTPENASIQIPR